MINQLKLSKIFQSLYYSLSCFLPCVELQSHCHSSVVHVLHVWGLHQWCLMQAQCTALLSACAFHNSGIRFVIQILCHNRKPSSWKYAYLLIYLGQNVQFVLPEEVCSTVHVLANDNWMAQLNNLNLKTGIYSLLLCYILKCDQMLKWSHIVWSFWIKKL